MKAWWWVSPSWSLAINVTHTHTHYSNFFFFFFFFTARFLCRPNDLCCQFSSVCQRPLLLPTFWVETKGTLKFWGIQAPTIKLFFNLQSSSAKEHPRPPCCINSNRYPWQTQFPLNCVKNSLSSSILQQQKQDSEKGMNFVPLTTT